MEIAEVEHVSEGTAPRYARVEARGGGGASTRVNRVTRAGSATSSRFRSPARPAMPCLPSPSSYSVALRAPSRAGMTSEKSTK
jgi:hypothetical protein